MNNSKLFIGNLVFDITEHELKSLLLQHGSIINIKLQKNKGFAFVEMSTHDEAEAVIANLNKTDFKGREMRIDYQVAPKTAKRLTIQHYSDRSKKPYNRESDGSSAGRSSDDRGNFAEGNRQPSNDYRKPAEGFRKEGSYRPAGRPSGRFQREDSGSQNRDYAKRFDRNDNRGRSAESLAHEGSSQQGKRPYSRFNRNDTHNRDAAKPFDRNDNRGRSAESLASEGSSYQGKRPYNRFNRNDSQNRDTAKPFDRNDNRGRSAESLASEGSVRRPYKKFNREDSRDKPRDYSKRYDHKDTTGRSPEHSGSYNRTDSRDKPRTSSNRFDNRDGGQPQSNASPYNSSHNRAPGKPTGNSRKPKGSRRNMLGIRSDKD